MRNTNNDLMGGMYAFDWGSIAPGNYDYQYVALNSDNVILNQQLGHFNTSDPASPSADQSAIAVGNGGRAYVSSNGYGAIGAGLQLLNQPAAAASATLKYRLKDSGQAWSSPIGLGKPLPGWFTLDTGTLNNLFTANNQYDIVIELRDSNNALISQAQADLTVDSAGNETIGTITVLPKLRLSQPVTAAYVNIRYRVAGSSGSYVTVPRLDPTSANSGLFDWDASAIASGNYDMDIQAFNADGILLNRNQVTATLTNGTISGAVTTQVTIPQVLRLTPTQSGVNSLQLGYRLKGSTSDYSPLTASRYDNNGSIEFRVNLPTSPALAANNYEYRYTTYASSDGSGTSLGTNTGYFTVSSATTSNARLDWVLTSAASSNQIARSQGYNAFGDVVQETDGRGNVTDLAYNTLGKLLAKRDPQTDITLKNGYVQVASEATRATTAYSYDLAGRLVATIDANGNRTTQTWLAGAPPDSEDMVNYEGHADGGSITRQYDLFGNLRIVTDEVGRSTDYTYDNEDRLTRIDRPQRVDGSLGDSNTTAGVAFRAYDTYMYDAAGQRIRHNNSNTDTTAAGVSTSERTYYDSLGRITQTSSYQGLSTQYSYVYSNAITGVGGASGAGWTKTTTNADTRTLTDQVDMFNHVTAHQDLSGRQFTYTYNLAGWLTSQTGTSGQNIAYSYYTNGYVQSIHDKATGMYTYYEYDKNGNKTFEGYISLKNPLDASQGARDYYQYARISYDNQNRIKTITDPKASINYEYDAVGNRRMVNSVYHDGVQGAIRTQEYWYSYDAMNRFTTTMGGLGNIDSTITTGGRATSATDSSIVINKGAAGGAGVTISYNKAGERTIAANASSGTTETYSYTADGYLENVSISDGRSVTRKNDGLGRVIDYQEKSGSTVTYSKTSSYDKDNRLLSETGTDGSTSYTYYTGNSTTASSSTGTGALATSVNTKNSTTVTTRYGYQYWDEAKQSTIQATPQATNVTGWASGYSNLQYDINGHLIGAIDTVGNRRFTYVADAQGLILNRSEIAGNSVNRVQRYYYVDGKRVGDVGNDGPSRMDYVSAMASRGTDKKAYKNWQPIASADFDQNYEPISPTYPGPTASSYTVKNGDTLQSIASAVWGDSAMWYLLADANGLGSNETLTSGQVLTIPNKVTNIHNTSGTFRPYNAGEAVGDTSPTIPTAPPPPRPQGKKGGCGGLGAILVAVVAVAVTISTWGSLGPVAATALGNVAGQVTGNVLGVQKGFDLKSFAVSVATAGITQGLVGGAQLPGGGTTTGLFGAGIQKALGTTLGGYGAIAARAVVNNVVGQGVGNLAGTQKGFSWSSVAAAGVGAAAGAYAGNKIGSALGQAGSFINGTTQLTKGAGFVTTAAQGITASLVSQVTQIAIDGRGKLNWANVAINGVSAGVGYLAGWVDPKNGGMPKSFGQGNLSNAETQIANGQRYAEVTGGTSTDAITLPKIPVTPTPRPLLDEVTETADRLMQLNSQYNPAMIAGKYAVGAAEMVGAGVYNEGVRIVGGLVSIPAAFSSVDAAVSIQNSVNERLSYTLRSSGSQSIGRAIQPLANAIDNGMQSARSYSESRIGNGATAALFGTAEFALEAGGLVTGGVAARNAVGRLLGVERLANGGRALPEQEIVGPYSRIRTDGLPSRLYHYTDEAGMQGILDSQNMNPSLKAINPRDVRYGNGQYLSDILPGSKTPAQLSKAFINNPFQGGRFKNYIEIDTVNLNIIKGRDGVYVIPNETPLDLTNRIMSSGKTK